MKCGLVGLPNVGKSTLFNALSTNAKAAAANFPFCTLEPNIGIVPVPDERLERLCTLVGSQRIVPAHLMFMDIAGLVHGASKGEGLGNQFLSHIREVDAILHVVRCFDGRDIVHVEGRVDPVNDAAIVETELLLADIQTIERRLASKRKDVQHAFLEKVFQVLDQGQLVSQAQWSPEEIEWLKTLHLLSSKPVIYVANVDEASLHQSQPYVDALRGHAEALGRPVMVLCNELEAQLAELSDSDRQEMLDGLGLKATGLSQVIKVVYDVLGQITFLTVGPKEIHAWTINRGDNALEAAGKIHKDFQRGFIRAQVVSYEDFLIYGSFAKAQEVGRVRIEGKEYIFQDGDIALFRFNV